MRLKYPLKDKQDAVVRLTEGTDDNGKPLVVSTESIKCTFIEQQKIRPNKEGKYIQISGIL